MQQDSELYRKAGWPFYGCHLKLQNLLLIFEEVSLLLLGCRNSLAPMSNKGLGSVFMAKFKKEEILGTFLNAEKSEELECICFKEGFGLRT